MGVLDTFRLDGKKACVTGGSRGLGSDGSHTGQFWQGPSPTAVSYPSYGSAEVGRGGFVQKWLVSAFWSGIANSNSRPDVGWVDAAPRLT